MDSPTITALGLQLYLLVDSSNNKNRSINAFKELMIKIGHEDLAKSIVAEMDDSFQEKLPFTRVVFDPTSQSDVQLPPEAKTYAFRIYRSGAITILRNTGDHTLFCG